MDARFSNYYDNVTTLHPLATAMLVVAAICVFVVPRRQVFLPMILLTVLVPAAQRVVIGGLDFHFLRLMIAFGWIRVLVRGENRPLQMMALDWAMVSWAGVRLLAVVARQGSVGAFVNQLGQGFDGLGAYFLARMLIRNWRDFDALVTSLIWASIPTFFFSTYEVVTARNPFHIFGQSLEEAVVREGRVRARGAFSHQILAGVYWAGVLPLMVGRFMSGRGPVLSAVGIACSVGLVINCASSTPLLGTGIAMVGGGFWLLRRHMRQVRWGIVISLLLIQMSMSKPIWHLLHRAGSVGLGASTSYHRYRLIEAFVNHFNQWALVGVSGTARWGRQLEDVTNHFIAQGVTGGLLTLVLFIAVYVYAYKNAGRVIRAAERSRKSSYYAWSLGVALLAHTAMMFATSYFGQILLPWYATFGAVGSLGFAASRGARASSTPSAMSAGRPRTVHASGGQVAGEPGRRPARLADLLHSRVPVGGAAGGSPIERAPLRDGE